MRRLTAFLLLASAFNPWPVMAEPTYIAYTNRIYLPVSFEYPSDWQAEPSTGSTESYSQVQLYAPPRPEDPLRTYLVVRVTPPKSQGGKYESLDDLMRSYRSTLFSSMTIEAERQIEVLGGSATEFDLGGSLRLPFRSTSPTLVPIKGQRVFLERDGRLYEVAWLTSVARGPEIEAIFSHLLASLAPNAS